MLKRTERELLEEIQLAREPDHRIGAAILRPASRTLEVDGESRVLEPRVAQLLVALARREGTVFGRDDLIDLCWGGRIVGEDAINRCVAKARRATNAAGFTIETIPKVGYRLVTSGTANGIRGKWVVAAGAGALCLALLILFLSTRQAPPASPEYPPIAISGFTTATDEAAVHARTAEIAPQVVDALAKAGIPTVRSETSDAARARFFVRGQINVKPDAVHALIQMEDARTGITLMSQELELDPDEMPLIADKVATAVAAAVTRTGTFYALTSNTSDPAEIAAFMDVVMQIALGDYLEAEVRARRLYASRPESRLAPFALSFATIYALPALPLQERREALQRARDAALLARRRLPEFGDVYIAQCELYPISFNDCEKSARQGLAVDPSAPTVRSQLALLLMNTGRLRDAHSQIEKALSENRYNPTKVIHNLYIAELLGLQNEEEHIWAYAQRFWPKLRIARQRYMSLMAAGRWPEAEAMLPLVVRVEPSSETALKSMFAALHRRDGDSKDQIRLACAGDQEPAASVTCLTGLSMTGRPKAAVEFATRFYPVRPSEVPAEAESLLIRNGSDPGPLFLLWGQGAAAMRRDPSFSEFAGRRGLIRYWRQNGPPDFCRTERAPVCGLI